MVQTILDVINKNKELEALIDYYMAYLNNN